ncbi:hypothetical protein GEV33_006535 [Tenebrio molitor]|uniref:Uncharacterized protein n=1 Tax=Tenebrio molitor TaxID=7067 RepID=A0A8J6HJS0_TENMO|nr:hypothetical protein GEV33_006535 [Tenebrio molitor]
MREGRTDGCYLGLAMDEYIWSSLRSSLNMSSFRGLGAARVHLPSSTTTAATTANHHRADHLMFPMEIAP